MTAAIITNQTNAIIASVPWSSSLECIAPSVPKPDTLKGIDDLIHAGFEAYRTSCFNWLLAATGLVVIGLVFEGPELWDDITSIVGQWRFKRRFHFSLPESHTPSWAKLLAFVGWLLIVVGVAGEYVADSFVSKADGYLQKFDEILLKDAQKQAGDAATSATKANLAASSAEGISHKADAEAIAAETKIRELDRAIARANDEFKELNFKREALEKSLNPRGRMSYTPDELDSLKRFKGTNFEIEVVDDGEALRASYVVLEILMGAEWQFKGTRAVGVLSGRPDGVTVCWYPRISEEAPRELKLAGLTFINFLNTKPGWDADIEGDSCTVEDENTVRITIGSQLNAYFLSDRRRMYNELIKQWRRNEQYELENPAWHPPLPLPENRR